MLFRSAREIADKERVFVGVRLPLLGFLLAKNTHAPDAVGVYELGIVRNTPSPEPIMTMGDLPNLYRADWMADTADVMGLLQQGQIDVSFIGGAQIDRLGNLNTTYIGGIDNIENRLPGSGGGCDLACLSKRHIIIMPHEKRRFVPKVDYITSPGFGSGPTWRSNEGLRSGGPCTVITTMGVLCFDDNTGEMTLSSIHPGVRIADLLENTGWPLKMGKDIIQTPAPSESELALLHELDPNGFWTGTG